MVANNGRNRTLSDDDFQAIRQIVRTEAREEVHGQLFSLEFAGHVGNIVVGALEVKLEDKMAPIRQGLRQAGEGLMAAGAEPIKPAARRRWQDADSDPHFSWYMPLRESATLLRSILEAAGERVERPTAEAMDQDVAEHGMAPLFVRGESDEVVLAPAG